MTANRFVHILAIRHITPPSICNIEKVISEKSEIVRFDPVGSKIYVVIDTIKKNHSLRIPEYPLLKVSATIRTVMRDNETFEKLWIMSSARLIA